MVFKKFIKAKILPLIFIFVACEIQSQGGLEGYATCSSDSINCESFKNPDKTFTKLLSGSRFAISANKANVITEKNKFYIKVHMNEASTANVKNIINNNQDRFLAVVLNGVLLSHNSNSFVNDNILKISLDDSAEGTHYFTLCKMIDPNCKSIKQK